MDWLESLKGLAGMPGPVSWLRAVIGALLVLVLPGFMWTLLLFKRINILERIALAIGLSIALVTLSLLFANRLGLKITTVNSLLVILAVTILPLIIYYLNKIVEKSRKSGT
ncbi:MAG: DUF1616 domain-containing protein [Chloroflexota bacterium]